MFKLVILFIFAHIMKLSLFANCSLDYSILYAIQKVERHPLREISYPYLISFNSKSDRKLAKEKLKKLNLNWIDSRSLDCKDLVNCEFLLREVEKLGIVNVDLGSFQLNFKFHKMGYDEYFSNKKSMERACQIIEKLIKKHGISADTIARYHSNTKKYKNRYSKKIFEAFLEEKQKAGSNIFYYRYP